MVIFGGAFWGNTVVDYFLGRHGDIAFLSVLLPNTGQASLYDVAFSVVQMGAVGMTIGLSGISLALASRIASESVRRLDLFTMTVVRFVSLLTIPLYAFLYWNIPLVLSVLYPASFNGAAAFVQGMVIFRLVSRLFGGGENADYLLARGKVVPLVLIGLLSASTNVLLDILLIPSLGARGAVIASGVANLTVNGLSAFLVMRRSSVSLQFVSWSLLVAASLLAAFVVSIPSTLENELGLLLRLTGFTALMVLGGLIVRPMTRLDLELLGRVDERMLPIVAPFVRKNRGGAFL
jgi:O-antigen/teichoic acid export membrane protein